MKTTLERTADIGRPALPRTTDEPIPSEAKGVAPASATKRIKKNVGVVKTGGEYFDFSSLQNSVLYPDPFAPEFSWAEGFLPASIVTQMLRHPKVAQSENNLIAAILGDGGRVIPAVDPSDERFEKAREIADFCAWCLRNMRGSWYGTARQFLQAVYRGNRVAAISCRDEEDSSKYKNKRVLDELQLWPNGSYEFYEDDYGRVVYLSLHVGEKEREDWPRGKFAVLTYRPVDDNPYGTTNLAACYEPYYEDVQAVAEEFAYAATFGGPSVIIYAAPTPEGQLKEEPFDLYYLDGTPVMSDGEHKQGTSVEQNAIMFTEYRARSIWSLEGGSKVEIAEARRGGSDLFENIRERANRTIVAVIMGTDQITESATKDSGRNTEAGEAVTSLGITDGKRALEEMVENDLFCLLVEMNYGASFLDLLPFFDLGSGQNGRITSIANSLVGFVTNGAYTMAQWWWTCVAMGWPLPYPGSPRVNPQAGNTTNKTGGAAKQPDES
jgi:hypothetical protein